MITWGVQGQGLSHIQVKLCYVMICCCLGFAIFTSSLEDQGFISFHLFHIVPHKNFAACSLREIFLFCLLQYFFRHETIISLLRCTEALVRCLSKRKVALDCEVVGLVNPILEQIWTSTLRVVEIKHLTDCGFSLLTMLLQVTNFTF